MNGNGDALGLQLHLPNPNADKANAQRGKSLEVLLATKNKRILEELAKFRVCFHLTDGTISAEQSVIRSCMESWKHPSRQHEQSLRRLIQSFRSRRRSMINSRTISSRWTIASPMENRTVSQVPPSPRLPAPPILYLVSSWGRKAACVTFRPSQIPTDV